MKAFEINNIQLKIQSPNLVVDEKLNDYIIVQIEKLGKKYGRIKKCDVVLKVEKSDKKKNCAVEVKLYVPGQILFAGDKQEEFQVAAKMVFDDLSEQLSRFKEKINDKSATVR